MMVVGRIMASPKNVHVLISRTYEFVILVGKILHTRISVTKTLSFKHTYATLQAKERMILKGGES